MPQEKPDDQPAPKKPAKSSDADANNPFSSPQIDTGKNVPRGTGGKVMSGIGTGLVVILLFIVVGFGLLVGCCALGVR